MHVKSKLIIYSITISTRQGFHIGVKHDPYHGGVPLVLRLT